MSNNQLATVEFHGQHLTVITSQNGEHLVAMKPICENIGLTWSGQYERIQRHEVLKSTIRVIRTVAEDRKTREVVCLPLDYLNGWLFGVDTNRVKPEIRPRLIQYQRECFHVLAAYWQQGEVTNPRKAKNPKVIAGAITEEQQSIIRALVKNHLETLPKEKQGAAARKCWGSLSKSFACKSYKDIPAEQFSEAVSLLSRRFLEGEFLGKAPEPKPLEINFPISWWIEQNPHFAKHQWGAGKDRLAVVPTMLYGMDNISPTLMLLTNLNKAGYEVNGCVAEVQALQHYMGEMRRWMKTIERNVSSSLNPVIRIKLDQ